MAKIEIKPKRLEILDANDQECQFRINIDVLNECFGINYKGYGRASYPQNAPTGDDWIPGTDYDEKFFIWMPKLYTNSSKWGNYISDDDSIIYEVAELNKADDYLFSHGDTSPAQYMKRLVFVKESQKSPYRFVGVFVAGEDDYQYKRHVFKRIATKVRIIGNPVARIEILE